ncbi:MAG: RNA polymerase sigma factor [bacterium]
MVDIPEISELVKKVVSGDKQTFGTVIDAYTPIVAATVARFADNESDREDLAQEVFIKAYKSLGRYRGTGSFEGWLRKITVQTCLDWLRKKKKKRSMPMSELNEELRNKIETNFPDPEGVNPQRKFEASAAKEILHNALKLLPPDEHLIIVLKELEMKSIREISEITGLSESNVKVKAHRARRKLKEILNFQSDKNDR